MSKIIISKYVDFEKQEALVGENWPYISPSLITHILVNELKLGLSYNELKDYCKKLNITLTEDEIKTYLNNKFEENDLLLKQRIEGYKKVESKPKNAVKLTQEEIEQSSLKFIDEINASKYSYESYTLEYYKRYTTILKSKIILFFSLIDLIQDCETKNLTAEEIILLKKSIEEYDLHINQHGIHYEDVIRILDALIFNIEKLKEKIELGNSLNTYLEHKISLDGLHAAGYNELDLYPRLELQVKIPYFSFYNSDGYILLTEEQENNLREEEKRLILEIDSKFE